MNITYQIVTQNNATGIKCLRCGRTSWNTNDVLYKFCAQCNEVSRIPTFLSLEKCIEFNNHKNKNYVSAN